MCRHNSQPTGFMTCASGSCVRLDRSARISVSVSSPGCLQFGRVAGQDFGHDRADGGSDEEGFHAEINQTRDGRGRVVSVQGVKTRWPVRLALVAMVAVSRSRISPIMMMFGAWRRMERSAAGNVMPIRCSPDLVDAGHLIFDRLFDGDDFWSGLLM